MEALSAILRDISKQKDAEAAIHESEGRFRVKADGCPAVMWVTNVEGGIQFINRAYRELTGTSSEDAEGHKWQMALHPEDSPAYLGAFQRAVRDHTPFSAEVSARRADGEWRWMASQAETRISSAGEYLGHVGISTDITDRRQAEQATRDSQEFARAMIDALSSHVCVLNEAGTIIAVNRAWKAFAAANRRVDCDGVRPESPEP